MRNPFFLILTTVLVAGSTDAASRELRVEPHAMFYYQVPFGGGSSATQASGFGFRLDRLAHSPDQVVEYADLMQRTAILDLRLNRHGVESFNISGVDYLKKYRIHRAAAEEGAQENEAAETGAAGDEATKGEEELPKHPTVLSDFGDTIKLLVKKAPLGVLIGAGIGVGLLVGSATD